MVLVYVMNIRHSMLCVTRVSLGDITNMIFATLHLNMSCLSICFSCLCCVHKTETESKAESERNLSKKCER